MKSLPKYIQYSSDDQKNFNENTRSIGEGHLDVDSLWALSFNLLLGLRGCSLLIVGHFFRIDRSSKVGGRLPCCMSTVLLADKRKSLLLTGFSTSRRFVI